MSSFKYRENGTSEWKKIGLGKMPAHAIQHSRGGSDSITPEMIGAAKLGEDGKILPEQLPNMDAYTKEETLSPTTKTALGLPEDAVPDNAFASLGWHRWRRRIEEKGYFEVLGEEVTPYLSASNAQGFTITIHYSDSINIDQATGNIELINPQSVNVSNNFASSLQSFNQLTGKYFALNKTITSSTSGTLYYDKNNSLKYLYMESATINGTSYNFVIRTYTPVFTVTANYVENIGEYEYVTSPNRHAYPDSGREGIFTYEYLGAPLENAKEAYGMRLHWWRRYAKDVGYVPERTNIGSYRIARYTYNSYYDTHSYTTYTFYCSSSYTINADGTISLDNPTQHIVDESNYNRGPHMKGMYFNKNTHSNMSEVYYTSSGATTLTNSDSGFNTFSDFNLTDVVQITTVEVASLGESSLVSSADADTYPHSGSDDYFTYEYIGVPFENAREGAKIVTGSYVGTGSSGSNTPNLLTFSATPKAVIISPDDSAYVSSVYMWGAPNFYVHNGSKTHKCVVTVSGNQMSWYSTTSGNASAQLNDNSTYRHLAIL